MTDEIAQPVSLGDLAREGRLLWCYCLACCHEREVDPLSLGLDPAEAVSTVGKRLKCSRCGSREIETKPQLHTEPLEMPNRCTAPPCPVYRISSDPIVELCSSWRKRRRRMAAHSRLAPWA